MINKRGMAAAAFVIIGLPWLANASFYSTNAQMQPTSRYFYETSHTVQGRFLTYWEQHGGLAQQGYPISEEMQEVSETNGQTYTVQYFERAVFEAHTENQPPNDVLLSLLGVFEYEQRYKGSPPTQTPNTNSGSVLFPETGKRLGGSFLEYWRSHGGLAQQGYPISDEFEERSELDGKIYTVQYFERAVLEWHPENQGTPYEVLLSQLGTLRYHQIRGEITIPQLNDRAQGDPQGSDAYLVWSESIRPPAKGAPPKQADIQGINLKTGRLLPVTTAPGDQDSPDIDGSRVVWVDHGNNSWLDCPCSIEGKDLSTGETFSVAPATALVKYSPVIAGRWVAWAEIEGSTIRLVMKDLTTGETQVVASARDLERGAPYEPQISEEYLVWLDFTFKMSSPECCPIYTYIVRAYDLKTGQVKTPAEGVLTLPGQWPKLSLSGHRLVWDDGPQVHFYDLQTGETRLIPGAQYQVTRPIISGETIIWSESYGELRGMMLGDQASTTLARDVGPLSERTIAGDWVVWQNPLSRLSVARLSTLFANPPTALPTPVPTQAGPLPRSTAIPSAGPDLTPEPDPRP